MVCMSDPVIQTPEPVSLYRPVWADPGFILSTNEFNTRTIDTSGGGIVKLAPNNPKRWAIGFLPIAGSQSGAFVGPWPDVTQFGWPIGGAGGILWFDLFTYGPMIAYEWYFFGSLTSKVRVIEVEIG